MKILAGLLLAIVIIIAVNAVLETNHRPKLSIVPGPEESASSAAKAAAGRKG